MEHNQAVQTFSGDYMLLTETNRSPIGLSAMLGRATKLAGIAMSGDENVAMLTQQGRALIGLINIRGEDNHTVLEQYGEDLYSAITIQGNRNEFELIQEGQELQNQIEVSGYGLQYQAIQTNTEFQLQQMGRGSMPIRIQHTGASIPVRIVNY
jgi:hypothetical protein